MTPEHLKLWRLWTSEYVTADEFVDASWYYIVGAALARRVWFGDQDQKTVYPNNYMLFVATPGVGKSMLTDEAARVLMGPKMKPTHNVDDDFDPDVISEPKPALPLAANSTTYEALVKAMSSSTRVVKTVVKGGPQDGKTKYYHHNSLAFVLDEVTTLFNKDAEKVMPLLLSGWSCTERHSHDTIGRGTDSITNLCINLLGGTQPDKFARINSVELISTGFSRRVLIITADRNRFERVLIPPPSPAQKEAKAKIVEHVAKLTQVYGQVRYTPEAWDYFCDWWESPNRGVPRVRLNKDIRLDHYYNSKHLHVHKIAMAHHFSDSLEMEIGLESILAARAFLESHEPTMHKAYGGGRDKNVDTKKTILGRMKLEPGKQFKIGPLYAPVMNDLSFTEFRSVMADLVMSGKVGEVNGSYVLRKE